MAPKYRAAFDISQFFDQEAFSDITIKFGSRELCCHKFILCTKSEYFNNICGPGKHFAESGQATIELKEDDEGALQRMFRWLYSFDYEDEASKKLEDQFQFHVDVCTVADKYGFPTLKNEAFKRLMFSIENGDDRALLAIMRNLQQPASEYTDEVREVVRGERNDRLPALLNINEFRAMLERNPGECMEVIDELSFAVRRLSRK
ncbi:hypothetical protein LTR08_003915 [Meristemomyces frigidus]|nr:hypothetical protein LTR08_003915 [Meristemomyces frigidus]